MSLDTCTVTGPVLRPDGSPCYPASVTFTLSGRERDGDATVMPAPVTVETASDGTISVELWPNAAGLAGTRYKVDVVEKITVYNSRAYSSWTIVVPDEETANLAEISSLAPPPSVNDAQAAAEAAQGYAASAHGYSDAAAGAALAAERSAASAPAAVGLPVSIFNTAGIDPKSYYADLCTASEMTLTRFYGRIVQADAGGSVTVSMLVNGALAYGPATLTFGASDLNATGLAIHVPAGAEVAYVVSAMSGGIKELYLKAFGDAQ